MLAAGPLLLPLPPQCAQASGCSSTSPLEDPHSAVRCPVSVERRRDARESMLKCGIVLRLEYPQPVLCNRMRWQTCGKEQTGQMELVGG